MQTENKLYCSAVIGGTFDNFHSGHKSLISTACRLALTVFIGVISDDYGKILFSKKIFKEKIQSLDRRIKSVESFIDSNKYKAVIGVLNDPYGPSITNPDADLIVVSHETRNTADKINEIREKSGLTILDVVTIPWEFTKDGIIISSSNIRKEKYESVK
ncbi:MAG: pantetheine-phosphate adenylyltransferase [Candidatus Heimdallarchaeota archaeon]|nr:pantetheine-phosphate adenylyltransferase [Candidatus Heimdallarchaeota archaeon]